MQPILIKKSMNGGYDVCQGDRYSDGLTYEEMIGVVAHLTRPEYVPYDNWMKTQSQWDAYYKRMKEITEQPLFENENERINN